MEKNYYSASGRHFFCGVCMLFCLLFGFSNLSAQDFSKKKVTLRAKDTPLIQVLLEVQKQCEVNFLYEKTQLENFKPITLEVRDAELATVLETIFNGSGFTYKITGNNITVVKQTPRANDGRPQPLKGKVTDEKGAPLPGVTVAIKGTGLGMVTDDEGKYALQLPAVGDVVLVYSFVGMKSQEVKFSGQKEINIVLQEDVAEMDEVVVTGIFERRKESFTGAATTITHKELLSRGNQNLIQSLKNLDPSLNIAENLSFGSDPNRLPDMELRGTSSFPDVKGEYASNPNLPLFILDGFETTLEKVIDLDINRIESVTLLKDAAAKAIYGSKAANGVMVIETVRVKSGELRVNYIGSVNLELPDLSSYNLCDAREKLDLEYKLGAYTGNIPKQDYEKKLLYYQNLAEIERGANTDWMAQPLRNGVGHKHSLNMEVGNRELRASMDLSYNDIKGVMKGSGRKTVSAGFSVIYQYKNLLFRNQFTFSNMKSEDSPYGDFSEYTKLNPYWVPYDEDGNLRKYLGVGPLSSEKVYNPMYNATINTTSKKNYSDYTNNTYIEWNVTDGMKLVGRVGLSGRNDGAEKFLPGSHLNFVNTAEDDFFKKGSYTQTYGKSFALSSDINLNYSHNWNKHILFANLGANIRSSKSESYTHQAVGFPNDKMDNIIFAKQYAEDSKPTGSESIDREVGVLLAVNYSYDDRYLADFSLRENASSQFGSENRWGSFWSAGLGWNVHNERFFKGTFVKQLRLRATMGYTGSQNFNSYQGMLLYNYFTDDSYLDCIGTYLEGLANNKLKWQQKFDTNYGVDINLWGRLNVKFDYYRAVTNNLLTDVTTPPSLGFASYKDNLGKLLNTGYEFRVNYQVYSRPENRTYVNIFVAGTHNKNKIKKISNSLSSLTDEQDKQAATSNKPFVRFVEGQSMSAIWAVRSLGIDPSGGKEVFVRPDGTLTDTWSVLDQVVCGDTEPKLRGNIGFSMEYKGLSVSLTALYRLGGYMYNSTLVDKVENASLNYNVDKRAYYAAWMQEGDIVQFKNIGNWQRPTQATSRFVQKLNEFDFSSLSVGYDFYRFRFVKKCKMERMQLMFNMNDIAKLSSVKIERGTSYPFARYCSFTLNVNF